MQSMLGNRRRLEQRRRISSAGVRSWSSLGTARHRDVPGESKRCPLVSPCGSIKDYSRTAMTCASPRPALRPAQSRAGTDGPSSAAVFTLVLWLGCLLVGAVGFALPYIRPQPAKQVETVKVEILDVELSNELAPPDFKPPPPDSPAAPPDALTQPSIPAPIPVARPSPAIAFAVPVEAPVRIVEPRSAAYTSVAAQTTADAPAPRALTFGQGEGRQPKPDYPLRARREGQEGSVTIRLTVGENGRVIAAEDVSPSPWPLLNESALRAVRERWRFSPGKLRRYEVSIRFELSK